MSIELAPPARRMFYEKSDLVRQLRELGLEDGDAVLVKVSFRAIGPLTKPGDQTLIESLLEAVGPRGTIVAITHSPSRWIFRRDPSYVYDPATAPCMTGRFAQAVMEWPGAYRSGHPTASMAAIGTDAREILGAHDHRAASFAPMKNLIERRGKQLNIGCHYSCPGYATNHYVYEDLGLADRSLLSGLIGCYFRNGDVISWFRQRDVPGCSLGFHKFYPLYDERSLVRTGLVGDADSYLIDAAEAFAVEREAVKKSSASFLCDDPQCFSCRGTKLFNASDMPRYFLTQLPRKFMRRLLRGRR
jgi:aminoglycoside 3-N-acetyltransferase